MDTRSVLVLIVKLETKSSDANVENLKRVFSDPYFIVQVLTIEPPPDVPTSKTLTYEEYVENYTMQKALVFAAQEFPTLPVLIVKDSSVSNITPSGMASRIKTALTKAPQADLYYLCKWNDACNKYVDVNGVTGIDHGSTLKWSVKPTSTQSIFYKTSSRDFIANELITTQLTLSQLLNNLVANGTLLATVFVPNIIDFDINLATSKEDYYKLNECEIITSTKTKSQGPLAFIWFSLIALLVLLVAWALIQLGPGS